MPKVAIIGFGNLGKMIAKYVEAHLFYDIYVYDTNKAVTQNLKGKYHVLSGVSKIPKDAVYIFLCLPTFDNQGNYTYGHVVETLGDMRSNLNEKQIIYITATAMPNTMVWLTTLMAPVDMQYNLVYVPQFLREDFAYEDFTNQYPIPHLVFGIHPKLRLTYPRQPHKLQDRRDYIMKMTDLFFAPLVADKQEEKHLFFYTDYKTAEHTKVLDSLHLMMRIALSNSYFSTLDEDVDKELLKRIVSSDKRLGTYGFDYGHSFGGRCLPNYLDGIKQKAMIKSLTAFLDESQAACSTKSTSTV